MIQTMILDIAPEKCTGCLLCELYCSLSHEGRVIPDLARISVLGDQNRQILIPTSCIPCGNNPCITACPEPGAILKNDLGAVIIIEELCTACGKCARACQIGAIKVHRLAGRGKKGKAIALKCDQCGGDPLCVKVCPPNAIQICPETVAGQGVHDRLLAAQQVLEEAISHE
jgi:Fe-S-cluster-containing hydrogenase component 2